MAVNRWRHKTQATLRIHKYNLLLQLNQDNKVSEICATILRIACEIHPLPLQQFQTLLTFFSKSFSLFPHGTCFLSVSNQYLALNEIYQQVCVQIPRNVNLQCTPYMDNWNVKKDSHPRWCFFPKGFHYHVHWQMHLQTTIQGQMPRFSCWATPSSFAITKGILFSFSSSTHLYA